MVCWAPARASCARTRSLRTRSRSRRRSVASFLKRPFLRRSSLGREEGQYELRLQSGVGDTRPASRPAHGAGRRGLGDSRSASRPRVRRRGLGDSRSASRPPHGDGRRGLGDSRSASRPRVRRRGLGIQDRLRAHHTGMGGEASGTQRRLRTQGYGGGALGRECVTQLT
jgi:hypothetical protein